MDPHATLVSCGHFTASPDIHTGKQPRRRDHAVHGLRATGRKSRYFNNITALQPDTSAREPIGTAIRSYV